MARRLDKPNAWGGSTDHSIEIAALQWMAGISEDLQDSLVYGTAAELLASHDQTGISLDEWLAPRMLVEHLLGKPIIESGV